MRIRVTLHQRMMLIFIPVVLLVFGGAIGYITVKQKRKSIEDTKELARVTTEKFANDIRSKLNVDFDIARAIEQSTKAFLTVDDALRMSVFKNVTRSILEENTQILSFWVFLELNKIDPTYTRQHGRVGVTYYRDQYNVIKYSQDTLDTGNELRQAYLAIKNSGTEAIVEPYFYSYTGDNGRQILETSVCVPIMINREFYGLVGADLVLDRYREIIDEIGLESSGSYGYLLSNGGAIVAYPDEKVVGKEFKACFPEIDHEFNISAKVKTGERFSFTMKNVDGEEYYCTQIPLVIGKTNTPWSLAVCVPIDAIKSNARSMFWVSLLIGLLGVVILSVLIIFFSKSITKPILKATKVLKELAQGELSRNSKLIIETGDEIEDIGNSVNLLIDGLSHTAEFAKQIGAGNLHAEYKTAGKNDILGNALLEMRSNLGSLEEENKLRRIEEDKQHWITEGLAKFGDILRHNSNQMEEMNYQLISKLSDYVGAIQGGIFVCNDEDDEPIFELKGFVAYDRRKLNKKQFKVGESLIGRCAFECLPIYIEDVPENYVNVTSGLGESNPRSLLIVPAIVNDKVEAVIELVSFNKFEQYQIEFLEKIGQNLASVLTGAKINEQTKKLLEQSRIQSEEMAAQEEEMRQNLEELQSTQEELQRVRIEEREQNEKAIEEIHKNRKTLMVLLDELPVSVYLKDANGAYVFANRTVCQNWNISLEKLVGHTIFDIIHNKTEAREIANQEKQILDSGKSEITNVRYGNESEQRFYESTKMPFYIDFLNQTGLLCFDVDITDEVDKGREIASLKAKIEELTKG